MLQSIVNIPRGWASRMFVAVAIAVFAIAGGMPVARAQQGSRDSYSQEMLRRYFDTVIKQYEIQMGDEILKLQPQPVMHWQNSERSQVQGSMYAFLAGSRPQVLVSIFTYEYRGEVRWRHELISLSDRPLQAIWNGSTVWTPLEGGVNWQPLPDTPPPAATPPRRLTQMRAIARQFSGSLKSPDGQQTTQLKLIPQPLLRYQSAPDGVIDGAVFSLAIATDPELLLVVEAVDDAAGQGSWRWTPIRAHYWELALERDGEQVWRAEQNMALQSTRANQQPESFGTLFPFHPPHPLPPADQMQ